jgi:hypothetical protein
MISVEFSLNELSVLTHVLGIAADEFLNHGCNEVNVTNIGLPSSAADELRSIMVKENVITNNQKEDEEGSKFLMDNELLTLIHNKLKKKIGDSK